MSRRMFDELKLMLTNELSEMNMRKKQMSKSLDDCIVAVDAINRMMERQEKLAEA